MDRASLTSRLQPCDDVLFQDLSGEGVLLNLKTGVYFGLDPVGTHVWRLLQAPTTVGQILDALTDAYDVGRDRCLDDLGKLLAAMADNSLILIDP